ncbi:MAG TPA: TonB-dependent receptor [Thermoanaerobaculia bacterium]|nr:TonB-dependent receptor [Thermoanaerobaculia bacterium]
MRSVILALLLALPVHADDEPVLKTEIVVTPERGAEPREEVPAAVTTLTKEQLDAAPATTVAEAVCLVPGMTMFYGGDAAGAPMVTARGFFGGGDVEYVKLLVDGVPVEDVESGLGDWQRYHLLGIDRIEVLRGPSSAVYGDTAMGGVVQLFTRDQQGDGGDVRLSGGSFGSRALDGSVRFERDAFRATATLFASATDGYREHAANDNRGFDANVERLSEASRLRVSLAASEKDREDPGALTRAQAEANPRAANPLFLNDDEQTTRRRAGVSYERFDATPLRVALFASNRDTDWTRTFLLAPGFGSTLPRRVDTHAVGASVDISHDWKAWTFRAGSDVASESFATSYPGVRADATRHNFAAFTTASWLVSPRVRLTGGLRRDVIRDESEKSAWSPRAGINVVFGETVLYGQLSRSFKAPTLDQLFDPRPFPAGPGFTVTLSNPDLLPQRAKNVEAGVSRATKRARWSLTAYHMDVEDEIDLDLRTFSYRNIGQSRHRGLEASAELLSFAGIRPMLVYAWTRVTAGNDRQLKNIPEHTATLLVAFKSVTLQYRWLGHRALDDDGAVTDPAVGRLDARFDRKFGPVRLQLDALNVTDERASDVGFVLFGTTFTLPSPGRSFRAALGYAW